MENGFKTELAYFLKILPPVQFCCVYGSTLHPNNRDKSKMVDYILGVSNPQDWHTENLKLNKSHYASWMVHLGGAQLITGVADEIGVGVHFNPYVNWNGKMLKYGVVRMHDLVQDILNWEKFYLSGRLQKPVHILVDHLDLEKVNSVNLRAAVSAALLLLPSEFSEEDLYAKICSLSYMGDVRMLFAEDKDKVKKVVQGQFDLFRSMYQPLLEEHEAKELLSSSSWGNHQANISQKQDGNEARRKETSERVWSARLRTCDSLKRRSCKMHAKRFETKGYDFKCKTNCVWSTCCWGCKCNEISCK